MSSTIETTSPHSSFPLSRLGFGGATIGLSNYLGRYDASSDESRAEAIASVRKAVELGVNYIDTAPRYGNGLSEELIGIALEGITTPLFIATKVSLRDPTDLRVSLENSLKRLRRSSVDLVQLHGSSHNSETIERVFQKGGVLDQMEAMKADGLCRKIGFTTEDNNRATYDFIESGRFDAIQLAYNLLMQHPYEPTRPFGSLLEAKKRNMLTITMRTATSGVFQRWVQMVNPQNTFDYTESLHQFVLSNKLVDVGLVGMRTEAVVEAAVSVWQNVAGRIDIDQLWNRFDA